jgi:16S rRNA (guanine966-N2)-methyltransferase
VKTGIRVIAGKAKGRRLETPKNWDGVRPTSDRLRETLFNILAPRLAGARVLDGYAGTGALGIEALSRGAAHVLFVEPDTRAFHLIGRNIEMCEMRGAQAAMLRAGFLEAATMHAHERFDLILLDPPYADPHLAEAVRAGLGILSDDGVLVLEHATRVAPPAGAFRTLKSGDSSLSFYRKQA